MRLKIFFAIIVLCFILLIAGLFYTQILKGPYYRSLSEQNRIVVIPLEAPRGKIYDRNGNVLVDNRISFDVSLLYQDAKDVNSVAYLLSDKLSLDKRLIAEKILLAKNNPFSANTIVEDVTRTNAIILEQYRIDYPGLIITTKPKRDYIYGKLASSIIGYLGKINQEELKRFRSYGYRMTDLIGRSGLEKQYDSYLRGDRGGMQVEIDSLGRQKNILHIKEPTNGKSLHLTLDLELQRYCDKLMGERRGTIIAMNPKNGEILAFISKPSFDPSIFIKPAKSEEVIRILKNVNGDYPLLNRGISCAYPPGSIFKIIVAIAALEKEKFSRNMEYGCSGYFKLSKKIFHCWKEEGHGSQNLIEAIKNSCNVFFYQLGLKVGVDDISFYARKLGFGRPSGIDLAGEVSGLVPNPQWKRQITRETWYPGDTVNYSIGQGYLLVTPIQVIRMMSVFANGGYLTRPYIVDRIDNVKISNPDMERIGLSKENINLIRTALREVVNDPRGTGMKARLKDVVVAGKTGTAQNPKGQAHGWFSGFAPFDDPKICVITFIEFGGKGGLEASFISGKVIEKAKEIGLL